MKKLAFVLGYAGSIMALVFSMLMIYLVPINVVSKTVEDIKFEMSNENIVAFNEVVVYAGEHADDPITDYSESGLIDYASKVADQSSLPIDEDVYEDTMAFVYRTALNGIVCMILVALSIIFSLVAFIGALVVRKASTTGAIMMLIAALVLLLSAIYTSTVLPMIIASVVLVGAGAVSFMPERQHVPHEARVRKPKPPKVKQAKPARQPKQDPRQQYAQRPQQPYGPPYGQGGVPYPQQQQRQGGAPYPQQQYRQGGAPYPQQQRPQYQQPYPPQYAQGQPQYPQQPVQAPVQAPQAPVQAPAQTMEIPFQQPVQAAPQSGVPFPEVEGNTVNPGEEK